MMNPVRLMAVWMGGKPWLPKYFGSWIPKFDRLLRKLTFGRFSVMTLTGIPEMFLTVAGRKTGILRTTPLLCVPQDGGGWLVAGSNWGQEKPPAWLGNVLAAETVEIDFHGRRTTAVPRRLEGEERAAAWQQLNGIWPNFEKYATRTDREIQVVRLTPA
jgi:deazaflavin-dependent oxidoreductase (nitroreductase family)